MNAERIIARFGGVVFVRLPLELRRTFDRCNCAYCTAHPDETPAWDTLAVPTDSAARHTWSVHMPDPVAAQRAADAHYGTPEAGQDQDIFPPGA